MHQIVFPRQGVFECELRGQKLVADANRALFFNRDESYRVTHPARCGDDCTVLTFDEELLRGALAELEPAQLENAAPTFPFAQAVTEPGLFALVAALRQAGASAHEQGAAEPLALDEVALALLVRLLRAAHRQWQLPVPRRPRASTVELHRQQIERAQVLLATRFAEPLSLDAIAQAVFCSPFHLARIFRRHLGLSLHQYRQRLRLREGLRRLAESREELGSLALDLGFASHSHFTDAFRAAYGLPPSACRGRLGSRRLAEVSQRAPLPDE
jgi:AraC-like DNA-binding protein